MSVNDFGLLNRRTVLPLFEHSNDSLTCLHLSMLIESIMDVEFLIFFLEMMIVSAILNYADLIFE